MSKTKILNKLIEEHMEVIAAIHYKKYVSAEEAAIRANELSEQLLEQV